jgi:hypothetical protein
MITASNNIKPGIALLLLTLTWQCSSYGSDVNREETVVIDDDVDVVDFALAFFCK